MPSWVLAATPDGPLATANLAEFSFYSDVFGDDVCKNGGTNCRHSSVSEPFDLLTLHSYGTAQSYKYCGVTNSLEDVTTTLLYDRSEQLVVAGQRHLHGRGVVLPELGRAFYVGKQKGNRTCWRACHYPIVLLASLRRTL